MEPSRTENTAAKAEEQEEFRAFARLESLSLA